jgi:hypothetical protein
LATQLPINRTNNLILNNNENELNIYIEDEEDELDELSRYFEEKRARRHVSLLFYFYI